PLSFCSAWAHMADDEPRNVKELLVEAKDASELLIDMAYAAVLFDEEDLADEVEALEERMGGYLRRLRTLAILAARSPEDAEAIESVLWIATAIDKIGDEASGRVKVREGAPAVGCSLRDLSLPTETGMWLLAIRRGRDWEFDPGPDSVVSEGDVLVYQGPEEGVNLIRSVAGAPPRPPAPETEGPPLSELDRAVDILVEMKNSAEVAVGLAYSSLLFNDRALAAEVETLEARSDFLHDELESWVLRAAPEARNPDDLRGLLRIAAASEAICDAARDMTWYVEHGEELHPIVQMALEETEEIGSEVLVEGGSEAEGRSLAELRLETETGMFVLAVQRGRRWVYRPRGRFVLRAGDRIIAIGPEEGADELASLCRVPAPAPQSGH